MTSRAAWLRDERVVTAIVLVGILLLALVVRVYRLPDLMVVGGDQARDALVVDHMLQTGQPVLQGSITSTGTFHRGPAYYYLLSGAYVLSGDDPIGGALLSVAADLAALLIAFVMVRGVAGGAAGLVTAALWAASPLLIHFARFQWNPIGMLPFAMLSIYAAIRIARGDGRWLLVLAPAWLIGWQNHELEMFLVPMLALVLVWRWRAWLKPRIVTGAAALSVLVMLPFIVQQLTHHFEDVRAILGYFMNAAIGAAVPSVNGQGSPSAADRVQTAVSWMLRALTENAALNLVLVAVAVIGLAWLTWRAVRDRSADAIVLVLYSFTPLLYAFWPSPIFSHYTLLIQPIPLILAGVGFAALARGARLGTERLGHTRLALVPTAAGAAGLALVIAVASIGSISATAAEQPRPQNWRNVTEITRQVLADAHGQPFVLRVKADYFPHIDWYPEWVYPFEHLGIQTDPTRPIRVDLPTYVIFDPADYADGATYGGHVVQDIRWAAFPAPTYGDQVLADEWGFNGSGSGTLDVSVSPAAVHLTGTSRNTYYEAIQTVPLAELTRYLVKYDVSTQVAGYGATSVYLQVFDAAGTLLTTLPDGGGDHHDSTSVPITASFIGLAPAGATTGALIVRWRGAGDAWFTNLDLRPVTSEAPW